MSPLVVRQVELAASYFVVTLLGLGAASVASVDPSNYHAVVVALGAAAAGAVQATVQHFFPFLTKMQVKE